MVMMGDQLDDMSETTGVECVDRGKGSVIGTRPSRSTYGGGWLCVREVLDRPVRNVSGSRSSEVDLCRPRIACTFWVPT